jgi:hypothetical protein
MGLGQSTGLRVNIWAYGLLRVNTGAAYGLRCHPALGELLGVAMQVDKYWDMYARGQGFYFPYMHPYEGYPCLGWGRN